MKIQTIMLHLWSFKNIKCNFTWVALLIMFLPVGDVRIKTTTISGSRETIIDN
jgi:hypothetical protein